MLKTVTLTDVEVDHLLTVLRDAAAEGCYYGRRDRWEWQRARIIAKLTVGTPQAETSREEGR